jgi:hypothetical protein
MLDDRAPGIVVPMRIPELGSSETTTRIVHVHARESGLIVDMLCVVRGEHVQPDARVKIGRLRRYPSPKCLTCGEPVSEASDVLPQVVSL